MQDSGVSYMSDVHQSVCVEIYSTGIRVDVLAGCILRLVLSSLSITSDGVVYVCSSYHSSARRTYKTC